MASFTEGASDGALNGTTEVELVAAPASSTRRLVRTITIQNRDSSAVTITVGYKSGANTRQVWKGSLAVNDTLVLDSPLVLDATNKSIAAVMSGAAATTNPDFTAAYADVT